MASLLLTALLGAAFGAGQPTSAAWEPTSPSTCWRSPPSSTSAACCTRPRSSAHLASTTREHTQVSAVWELHHSDPRLGARQLYSAGIRIGRDHIASTVNTLVLAYTAAGCHDVVVAPVEAWQWRVLTTETLAIEIVQTLVGSIGLVGLGAAHHRLGKLGRHPRRP